MSQDTQQLSPEVKMLMDQFLRDMVRLNCGVFGIVYTFEPSIAMGLMRTGDGDPLATIDVLRDIIKGAVTDGRVRPEIVTPLQ